MEEIKTAFDQCMLHALHVRSLSPSYVKAVRYSCEMFFEEAGIRSLADCTFFRVERWLLD